MSSEALSPKEVAAKLGVSVATVYNLLNRGELRAFRVGRATRIPQEAIERYVAANRWSPVGIAVGGKGGAA